jgi:hypothetical protein
MQTRFEVGEIMRIESSISAIYSKFGTERHSTATTGKPTSNSPSLDTSTVADRDQQFDFTNMSIRERRQVANQLFQSGQISLDEAGVLGMMGPIAHLDGRPLDDSDLDIRGNAMTMLNDAIAFAKAHPNEKSGLAIFESLLSKLNALQGHASGINTQA